MASSRREVEEGVSAPMTRSCGRARWHVGSRGGTRAAHDATRAHHGDVTRRSSVPETAPRADATTRGGGARRALSHELRARRRRRAAVSARRSSCSRPSSTLAACTPVRATTSTRLAMIASADAARQAPRRGRRARAARRGGAYGGLGGRRRSPVVRRDGDLARRRAAAHATPPREMSADAPTPSARRPRKEGGALAVARRASVSRAVDRRLQRWPCRLGAPTAATAHRLMRSAGRRGSPSARAGGEDGAPASAAGCATHLRAAVVWRPRRRGSTPTGGGRLPTRGERDRTTSSGSCSAGTPPRISESDNAGWPAPPTVPPRDRRRRASAPCRASSQRETCSNRP